MFTEESLLDLFEVADLLSQGDQQIYEELRLIVFEDDSNVILDFLIERLQERDFQNLSDQFSHSQVENAWWIMLYLLANRGHLCMIEPNIEEAEFWARIRELQCWNVIEFGENQLEQSFHNETSVTDCLAILQNRLEESDYCVARIAMEVDWDIIFICSKITYERLRILAEQLGYAIKLVKEE
ncbi:TPA: hypothetical protein ACGOON_000505 [Streptococcus suis]